MPLLLVMLGQVHRPWLPGSFSVQSPLSNCQWWQKRTQLTSSEHQCFGSSLKVEVCNPVAVQMHHHLSPCRFTAGPLNSSNSVACRLYAGADMGWSQQAFADGLADACSLMWSTCRSPSGAAMLARITQLINSVLADVPGADMVTDQQVIDLIGEQLAKGICPISHQQRVLINTCALQQRALHVSRLSGQWQNCGPQMWGSYLAHQ